jgi:hypothetical protein
MAFFDKLTFWKKAPEQPLTFDNLPPLPGEEPRRGGRQGMGGEDFFGGQGGLEGGTGQDLGGGFGASRYGDQGGMGEMPATFKPGAAFQPVSPQQTFSSPSQFANLQQQPTQSFQGMQSSEIIASKNMEIISSKIDALSAQLESINQRLRNIERIALEEEKKEFQKRW